MVLSSRYLPFCCISCIIVMFATSLSCSLRGSSFQALGIPTPSGMGGEGAIVLGWAREEREGWVIERVRLDSQGRREWNGETQRPAVIYLNPGEHEIRVYAAKFEDSAEEPVRRIKMRPHLFAISAGEVQLCVLQIREIKRRWPTVECIHYLGPSPDGFSPREDTRDPLLEKVAESVPSSECASDLSGQQNSDLQAVLERLTRIEQQLETLSIVGPSAPRLGERSRHQRSRSSQDDGLNSELQIDLEFPRVQAQEPP